MPSMITLGQWAVQPLLFRYTPEFGVIDQLRFRHDFRLNSPNRADIVDDRNGDTGDQIVQL